MVERDNFYIVLPSNSSMRYFPENTTTHFITQLPTPLRLTGDWSVSLAEIHIPMTFLHIPAESEKNFISVVTERKLSHVNEGVSVPAENIKNFGGIVDTITKTIDSVVDTIPIPHGIYGSIHNIIEIINELPPMKSHLCMKLNYGGFVTVERCCGDECSHLKHSLLLSSNVQKILGFSVSSDYKIIEVGEPSYIGSKPASISNALPGSMYVYTDICESYVTGDIQTPLLRVVPLDVGNYTYGCMKIKCFSPQRYIPLLHRGFQTIEIDIRDEFGEPIPFECGTLTVTLQFRRIG